MSSTTMRKMPIDFEPWQWAIPAPSTGDPAKATARKATWARSSRQELWAGIVYLTIWSVLWLAVIVAVLSPLDGLFAGAR